jgi:hypothetical protein
MTRNREEGRLPACTPTTWNREVGNGGGGTSTTWNREVGNGGGGTPMSARGAKRPSRQP